MIKKYNNTLLLLTIFIAISAFLRFYNLNWGAPYYFHPDERNIASAVSQLNFPNQMNPHFFAYGSLPIYVIYFTGLLINVIPYNLQPTTYNLNPTFEQAIIISRFYSALFSVLLTPLLFLIGKTLKDRKAGLLSAFLAATSIGFIQFAHFGTFEMWLTFFGTLLFWLCLKKINESTVFLMGLVFGVLVATKVSSLALLPLPLLAIIANNIRKRNSKSEARNPKSAVAKGYGRHGNLKIKFALPFRSFSGGGFRYSNFDIRILALFKNIILFLLLAACVYTVTNPYVFWDTKSFESSMKYESSVALGTLPVFYTGEFYNAVPGLFHFLFVYPFLLNPLMTVIFIPSCIYMVYRGFKTRTAPILSLQNGLMLISFFTITFLSQIFLFVKWTRYMVPTLPFVYLIIAIALTDLVQGAKTHEHKNQKKILHFCTSALLLICAIFSLSYFITTFVQPDTRIVAKEFALTKIPPHAQILSEVYDLGIIPFNNDYQKIELFNFYDLDPTVSQELQTKLHNSEYIILPSQRILKIRINNPEKFPNGSSFYNSLITGKLGYEKVYETPCDLFCKIAYLGDPVFRYEETTNVFERPTVFIFRRK